MNLENDPELIHLELKYCERCGGLWLRLHGTDEVYCACRAETTNLPAPPRSRPRNPRLPGTRFDIKAQRAAVLEAGGRA